MQSILYLVLCLKKFPFYFLKTSFYPVVKAFFGGLYKGTIGENALGKN